MALGALKLEFRCWLAVARPAAVAVALCAERRATERYVELRCVREERCEREDANKKGALEGTRLEPAPTSHEWGVSSAARAYTCDQPIDIYSTARVCCSTIFIFDLSDDLQISRVYCVECQSRSGVGSVTSVPWPCVRRTVTGWRLTAWRWRLTRDRSAVTGQLAAGRLGLSAACSVLGAARHPAGASRSGGANCTGWGVVGGLLGSGEVRRGGGLGGVGCRVDDDVRRGLRCIICKFTVYVTGYSMS